MIHRCQFLLILQRMKPLLSLLIPLIATITFVNSDQRVTGLKDVDDYHVMMKT